LNKIGIGFNKNDFEINWIKFIMYKFKIKKKRYIERVLSF